MWWRKTGENYKLPWGKDSGQNGPNLPKTKENELEYNYLI